MAGCHMDDSTWCHSHRCWSDKKWEASAGVTYFRDTPCLCGRPCSYFSRNPQRGPQRRCADCGGVDCCLGVGCSIVGPATRRERSHKYGGCPKSHHVAKRWDLGQRTAQGMLFPGRILTTSPTKICPLVAPPFDVSKTVIGCGHCLFEKERQEFTAALGKHVLVQDHGG